MDGLLRWYRTSVFPEALQRTQVMVSGLVGFLVGIVSDVVKDRFPSHVPEWFVVTPGYMWGAVGVVVTLLVVLFISDARRTTRLMALEGPRLEVVFEPGTCDDCDQMVGGVREVSVGLWNPSALDVDDVHVFVESLEPTLVVDGLSPGVRGFGFTGKREIWGLGQPGVPLGTIRGSSRTGHSHVYLLSQLSVALEVDRDTGVVRLREGVSPDPAFAESAGRGRSGYNLEVGGRFPLHLKEYTAMLSVEAANMRPHVVEVLINTGVSPPITGLRPVA